MFRSDVQDKIIIITWYTVNLTKILIHQISQLSIFLVNTIPSTAYLDINKLLYRLRLNNCRKLFI